MKSHPRIRKAVKWGSLVTSVALAVIGVGSAWKSATWIDGQDFAFGIGGGGAWVTWDGLILGMPRGWTIENLDPAPSVHWRFEYKAVGPDLSIGVPLWCPTTVACFCAAAAWRLDAIACRRSRIGCCPSCRYDRTGLAPDAVCPECGAAAPVPRSVQA